MAENKQEQSVDKKKIILISVSAGLGTLLLAFLIWSAIFSSKFTTFNEDNYHISIKYPHSWSVIEGYEGTVVAFVSPKEDSLDVFQESLNIAVKDLSQAPMSLAQYTQLAIKQTEVVFQDNITTVESKSISFAGFPAYVYAVKATSPQGATLKFVWFIKDNQAYTITCALQSFRAEKYAAIFDEMIRSFSILAF